MALKKNLLITLSLFTALNAYSKIGISSYATNAIAINTNQSKAVSGEFKTFTNQDLDNLSFEIDGFYNFEARTYHQISVGLGVKTRNLQETDLFKAFTLPLALQLFPIQNLKQFSVIFELTPEFDFDNVAALRHLWGVRYTFGKE